MIHQKTIFTEHWTHRQENNRYNSYQKEKIYKALFVEILWILVKGHLIGSVYLIHNYTYE